jgi:hypothetical protein
LISDVCRLMVRDGLVATMESGQAKKRNSVQICGSLVLSGH